MIFAEKMKQIKKELLNLNHEVYLTDLVDEYIKMSSDNEREGESSENKIKYDMIKKYYNEIKASDAILVLNIKNKGVENRVGENTFLEIGFAYVLDKKIFFLNPIPKMNCTSEIVAMKPIIINGDLKKIK